MRDRRLLDPGDRARWSRWSRCRCCSRARASRAGARRRRPRRSTPRTARRGRSRRCSPRRSACATTASASRLAAREEPVRAEVHPRRRRARRRRRRRELGRGPTETSTSTLDLDLRRELLDHGDRDVDRAPRRPTAAARRPRSTSTTVDETTVEPKPEIRFYAGRVDVTVGPLGKAKQIKDVALPRLPARRQGAGGRVRRPARGRRARPSFSVSSDVAETDGRRHPARRRSRRRASS